MVGNTLVLAPEAPLYAEPRVLDTPQDECGFVSVNSFGKNAGRIAILGVSTLDGRGFDATGALVLSPDGDIEIEKGFGTGEEVFPDGGEMFGSSYPAHQSLAHARYNTQGTRELSGAQPHWLELETPFGSIVVSNASNNNLKNTEALAKSIGIKPGEYSSDSEVMLFAFADTLATILSEQPDDPISARDVVIRTLPKFHGAYMGAFMLMGETVVYSDPHGIKPGVIGSLPDGGIITASEVTALDANGAKFIQEVAPGTIVVINETGSQWYSESWAEAKPAGCLVDLLYGIRPNEKGTKAEFHGLRVATARKRAGFALASVAPVEADFVCGMPNTAAIAGKGYQQGARKTEHAIAHLQYLKARNLKRSFIAGDQLTREEIVRKKIFVPDKMQEQIKSKRLVLVDDSLMRGTTARVVVSILKEFEPAEIHLRIAYDRVQFICDLGMDMGDPAELLAATMTNKEICEYLGIDSIAFLPVELIEKEVLGKKAGEFCTGCLTGKYPTDTRSQPVDGVSVSLGRKSELVSK